MARVGAGRGVRLAAVVVAALAGVFAVPAAAVAGSGPRAGCPAPAAGSLEPFFDPATGAMQIYGIGTGARDGGDELLDGVRRLGRLGKSGRRLRRTVTQPTRIGA
jgi:hypothetical protein